MESTQNRPSAPFAGIQYHNYPEKLKPLHAGDKIVPSNFYERGKLGLKKQLHAWTTYTAKGFTGSKDANFYELLAMGSIPYVIGSLTMMIMPNAINHLLAPRDRVFASRLGMKAGLGVLFYGLAKHFSKRLVEEPVKWTTGVDLNLPYIKYSHELPTPTNNDPVRKEGHFVYESVEFARTDRLANYEGGPEKANVRFDKIAKKLGYKEQLTDSDQIVKPKIREITTKTKTVTYLTQYLWATLGVALAIQKTWDKLVPPQGISPIIGASKEETKRNIGAKLKKLISLKSWLNAGKMFRDSAISLYKGDSGAAAPNISKYAGKSLVWSTLGLTFLGTMWIIGSSRQKDQPVSDEYTINKKKDYTVA